MKENNEPFPFAGGESCLPGTTGPTGVPLLPDLDFPPDPQLEAQGWKRRFMADPVRVKEATRLYTELGFEVCARAIQPAELSLACGDCRLATCLAYVTIYTRKHASQTMQSAGDADKRQIIE